MHRFEVADYGIVGDLFGSRSCPPTALKACCSSAVHTR